MGAAHRRIVRSTDRGSGSRCRLRIAASRTRRRRNPADLYDKAKVYFELVESIVVSDLDDISVRSDLTQVPSIAEYLSAHRLPDLDRSVLAGRHLDLTRTISGHLMRYPFAGHQFAGIRAQSRHSGITFAHFEGHYRLRPPVVGPIRLTPDGPDVNCGFGNELRRSRNRGPSRDAHLRNQRMRGGSGLTVASRPSVPPQRGRVRMIKCFD